MKRGRTFCLSLASVLVGSVTSSVRATDPTPTSAAPIFTNKAGFRIPYHYDAQEISRLGAREIRLFSSSDRGATWRHIQSVTPTAGKFEFQAPADGEYWFSVRTLDGQNGLHPSGTMTPGLMVVVDSQLPKLNIDLREREGGKVELNWSAIDNNLAAETLRLEFTQPGQDWQPVGVTPQNSGQTAWTVPSGGLVAVRGQVQDKAGNIGRSQYQIQMRGGAMGLGGPAPTANPFGQPAVPPAGPVAGSHSNTLTATSPFGLQPTPRNWDGGIRTPGGIPASAGVGASGFGSVTSSGVGFPNLNSQVPGFSGEYQTPASMPNTQASSGLPFSVGFPAAQGDATPKFTPVSDRGGQRTVNSKRFQLNYRVDDVGPSGVSAVELYITQNDGQKWFRYGVDEDRRSPFEIEVPGDGIYGFIIRVISGAGQGDAPPQPGQRPDVVVVVDASPPVVQLFPLRQGQGRDSNKILISWQAADQQLAEAPIALSYSADPNGPWEPIAGWQPNSGTFVWNVGPNVPPRLFVRLIARDSAGNLAKVDTPQPVLVDLAKPSARIVDVESAQSTRGAY